MQRRLLNLLSERNVDGHAIVLDHGLAPMSEP